MNRSEVFKKKPLKTGFRKMKGGMEEIVSKKIRNRDVGYQAAIQESKLDLEYATHDNSNDPTDGEKAALAGTAGTPSNTNRYVTDEDPRLLINYVTVGTDPYTPANLTRDYTYYTLGQEINISGAAAGDFFRVHDIDDTIIRLYLGNNAISPVYGITPTNIAGTPTDPGYWYDTILMQYWYIKEANSTIEMFLDSTMKWAFISGDFMKHSKLVELTTDDHAQYALLAGRSGGQTLNGGNAASEDFYLSSTADGTKGFILFGNGMAYDETNVRLGVGTQAPIGKIQTVSDGVGHNIYMTAYYNGGSAQLIGQRATGSFASPTYPTNGVGLFRILSQGWDENTAAFVTRASIYMMTSQLWTSTAQGTQITFRTTENGTTTETERVKITNDGKLQIPADSKPIVFGAGTDMSIDYDGTQGNIKTDLVAPSDLHIDCGTDKTIVLDETVWEDVQFQISSGKVGMANVPTWETFTTNTSAYSFAVNDYIDLGADEVPHGWKEGTNGSVHLHLALKAANSSGANRYVKFTVVLAYADVNEVWAETTLTAEYTIPTGTAALTHLLLSMGTLTLTNNLIGTQIKPRITRIAATGGTEYSGNIFVTQCGIHVEKDTVGSRSVSSK